MTHRFLAQNNFSTTCLFFSFLSQHLCFCSNFLNVSEFNVSFSWVQGHHLLNRHWFNDYPNDLIRTNPWWNVLKPEVFPSSHGQKPSARGEIRAVKKINYCMKLKRKGTGHKTRQMGISRCCFIIKYLTKYFKQSYFFFTSVLTQLVGWHIIVMKCLVTQLHFFLNLSSC